MVFKWTLLFLCVFVAICESAYVETLQKCSFSDQQCLKDLIHGVLKDISKNGLEDAKIQPIDPLQIESVTVPIMGLVNITLVDGIVLGVKECVVDSIITELDVKPHTELQITCDIIIKGKYTVKVNPLIQNILGGNEIRGDGNGKVKVDKLHLKFDYFYKFVKKEDGEIYIECHPEDSLYEYFIDGLKLSADKIFLGNQDISDLIVPLLNQNWRLVMDSFGKNFFDVAVKMFFNIAIRFFEETPAKYYIADDLTPYVSN